MFPEVCIVPTWEYIEAPTLVLLPTQLHVQNPMNMSLNMQHLSVWNHHLLCLELMEVKESLHVAPEVHAKEYPQTEHCVK